MVSLDLTNDNDCAVQMLQDEGMSGEEAEQRIQQVSSDMQAIIGMQTTALSLHHYTAITTW